MFSRKRTEAEDRKMADPSDDLGIPMKPARPAAPGAGAPTRPPAMPPRAPDLARAGESIRPPEVLRRASDPGSQPRGSDAEIRRLMVARGITMSGEITARARLLI